MVRLAKRKDVSDLVNACDAGREGELIFRLIEQFAGGGKAAGQAGEAAVAAVDDAAGDPRRLRRAAHRQADARAGPRRALALRGRLAGRHQRHAGDDGVQFARRRLLPHHRGPRADADAGGGGRARRADPQVRRAATTGKSTPPSWPKQANTRPSGSIRSGRRTRTTPRSGPTASGPSAKPRPSPTPCAARPPPSPRNRKPTTQASPLLFDLTSLQREANGRFGFSAKTTLALAQSLYERHKALTYPRTDSRALPEDYLPVVKQTMGMLANSGDAPPGAVREAGDGRELRQAEQAHLRQRQGQRSLCDHPDAAGAAAACRTPSRSCTTWWSGASCRCSSRSAEFMVTTRISQAVGHSFKTEGKVLVKPGWLAIWGKEAAAEIADAKEGDKGQAPGAGQARRDGARRSRRAQGAEDPAAGALFGSDAARRDGRRRQAGGGRRAARSDAGKGPGHAGDARRHHRRADQREIHATAKAAS